MQNMLWNHDADADNDAVCSDERGTGLLERITNDHRSLLQLQLYDASDRDSGNSRSVICGIEFNPFSRTLFLIVAKMSPYQSVWRRTGLTHRF